MATSALNKATTSDPSPTPGYLYEEIAKHTLSDYDSSKKIGSFLLTRLQNKNANVKWKCLQVIRHVALRGAPNFKQDFVRGGHLADLKACLQFSGPPDPLRGDDLNKRVRDAAAQAMEAVTSDGGGGAAGGIRMQGLGSSSNSGANGGGDGGHGAPSALSAPANACTGGYAGGGGGAGGGRMQGIGSEPWDPNAANQKKSGMMAAAMNMASKVVYAHGSTEQRAMAGQQQQQPSGDLSHQYASNRGANAYTNNGSWQNTPGFGGGGSNSANGNGNGNAGAPVGWNDGGRTGARGVGASVWAAGAQQEPVGGANGLAQQGESFGAGSSGSAQAVGIVGGVNGHGGVGSGTSDGAYERSLVEDLCAAGGTRAVPNPEALEAFLSLCPSLDPALTGPRLVEILSDQAGAGANPKGKALAVCSAVAARSEASKGCARLASWLAASRASNAALESLASTHPKLAPKCHQLQADLQRAAGGGAGGAVSADRSGSVAPQTVVASLAVLPPQQLVAAAPVVEAVDLLGDFGDEDAQFTQQQQQQQQYATTVPPPPPVAAQVATAQPAVNLFGSLAVKTTPPPHPPTAAAAPPALPTDMSAVQQQSGGLFAGVALSSNHGTSPAPPTVTAPQFPSGEEGLLSAHGMLASSPAAPNAAAHVVDPFELGNLSTALPVSAGSSVLDSFEMPAAGPAQNIAHSMTAPQAPQGQGLGVAAMHQSVPHGQPGAMGTMGSAGTQMMLGSPQQPAHSTQAAALQYQNMMMMQQMQMNQMRMQQMMAVNGAGCNGMVGGGGNGGDGIAMPNSGGGVGNGSVVPLMQGGMLSPARANAPMMSGVDALDAAANKGAGASGFDFMGGSGSPNAGKEDAFSFVKASMSGK